MSIVAHICHPIEAVIADPEVARCGEERPQIRQKSAGDERPRRKNLFTVGAFDLRPEVGLPTVETRCVLPLEAGAGFRRRQVQAGGQSSLVGPSCRIG